MARAARAAGFEVHVATRTTNDGDAIRAEGFIVHHVPFARGRMSPVAALQTVRTLRRIHREVRPTIAHHVALQPSVLASLAVLDRDVICLNALTGFGFAFTGSNRKAKLLRPILGTTLRLLVNHRDNVALVQNPDDYATLTSLGVPEARIHTIAGSGVDLARFHPTPEPPEPVRIGFVGRLLFDKGVHTLVAAHELLRARGLDVTTRLAGRPDPGNPTSIPSDLLEQWKHVPGLELVGHVREVDDFLASVHIVALPSRREGMPKSLLEAAASGRPMVASNVPGCREAVVQDRTGFLVPADDAEALADALEKLARSSSLRARFGSAARALAEERFGADRIANQISALYRKLVQGRHAS